MVYKVYLRGGPSGTPGVGMDMTGIKLERVGRPLRRWGGPVLLLVLAAMVPAWAQGTAARSALIVGVSTYASPDVSTLTGVPADIPLAQDMARAMGIPDERTQVLRDGQATGVKIGMYDFDRILTMLEVYEGHDPNGRLTRRLAVAIPARSIS